MQWRFLGGGGAMALGLALFMPKKGLALSLSPPPPPPPPPPQCICQNVQKYSVRCLKVVPGVPKMVLIRSKIKKIPTISSKAACKICPKVIPDGPKMAWIGSKSKNFQRPQTPAALDVHTQGPAYKKWPRAPTFENRHCFQAFRVKWTTHQKCF